MVRIGSCVFNEHIPEVVSYPSHLDTAGGIGCPLSHFWSVNFDHKITADGDCSHEIKRRLVLGRKAMTNLDSILKSRDSTLSTNVCLVKVMVFPVVMYGCDSWTMKKAERQRIDAFKSWCWRDF